MEPLTRPRRTGPQERAPSAPRARPERAQSAPRARPECWMVFRRLEKSFSSSKSFFQPAKRHPALGACSGRALGALWARSGRALGALSSETPRRGRGPVGAWSVFLLVETALALEEREFPLPGKHVSCFDFRNTFARCPIERSVFGTCLLGALVLFFRFHLFLYFQNAFQ